MPCRLTSARQARSSGKNVVPSGLRHQRFVAAPLTATTAPLDYASYMASPDVIRAHSDGRWSVEGFTFSDDLELVAKHEDDHKSRRAFTFVLLTPSGTDALGCLYMSPLREYLLRATSPRPPDLRCARRERPVCACR